MGVVAFPARGTVSALPEIDTHPVGLLLLLILKRQLLGALILPTTWYSRYIRYLGEWIG